MRSVGVVAAVGLLANIASADSLPQPAQPVEMKSPNLAVAISFGATAAGGLLMYAGDRFHAEPVTAAGLFAFAIGPTTGHFYAGRVWSTSLGVRLASAGGMALGLAMVLPCIENCSNETMADAGGVLLLASAITYSGATLMEIATAEAAARETNVTYTIAPLRARDGTVPGFAIAGHF